MPTLKYIYQTLNLSKNRKMMHKNDTLTFFGFKVFLKSLDRTKLLEALATSKLIVDDFVNLHLIFMSTSKTENE